MNTREPQRLALADPAVRRVFEEEFLYGEATDTLTALLRSQSVSGRELARRLGVTPGRVSQILSGEENLTLRSLAALGWALGLRFELHPMPLRDRAGTPAESDPIPPAWLTSMRAQSNVRFRRLVMPQPEQPPAWLPQRKAPTGELRAAA